MPGKESLLKEAVDLARAAAIEAAERPDDVGEHVDVIVDAERLVTHRFASKMAGYPGWFWTVTLTRVPRGRVATVCEVELLPGPSALLAPAWVPWADRIRPGDIGPGDVLPFKADDPRLEPGWKPAVGEFDPPPPIPELALLRNRVLNANGRAEAASRWYRGKHGPTTAGALKASAACSTCAFALPLAGSMGQMFAVCANEWSPDDGQVVSLDHGCGAHSETDVDYGPTNWPDPAPIIDEHELVPVQLHKPLPDGDTGAFGDGADDVADDGDVADDVVSDGGVESGSGGDDGAGDNVAGDAESSTGTAPDAGPLVEFEASLADESEHIAAEVAELAEAEDAITDADAAETDY